MSIFYVKDNFLSYFTAFLYWKNKKLPLYDANEFNMKSAKGEIILIQFSIDRDTCNWLLSSEATKVVVISTPRKDMLPHFIARFKGEVNYMKSDFPVVVLSEKCGMHKLGLLVKEAYDSGFRRIERECQLITHYLQHYSDLEFKDFEAKILGFEHMRLIGQGIV